MLRDDEICPRRVMDEGNSFRRLFSCLLKGASLHFRQRAYILAVE